MNDNPLLTAFRQTEYRVSGHGPRDVRVLKEAFSDVDASQESDLYGKGKVIEDFQAKMAQVLGKESAVFFPSGTMAQQIALRIWCDREQLKQVAYHPLCHLEIHEEDGLRKLHHIKPILLAEKDRLIDLDDVVDMEEKVSCLLLELPQREIGGQLPSFGTLESIASHCRGRGIKLHLDGARLWEVLPYYQKSVAEVCALFNSVYVSFYKGLGGIAGAVLAGDADFVEESKTWKRRHGGDLISLYPYIVAADYYFELRKGKMGEYYEGARELALLFNQCAAASTRPTVPVSRMFHVHFDVPGAILEKALVEVCQETGVGFSGSVKDGSDKRSYFEVSIGDCYAQVPKERLRHALDSLDAKLG